ncbi:type V CRISPR-associated protein Cas4 [Candidatus Roizmanbacteria bacterium CG_4_9_14_0_2_um_filter_39_13]|uniref:Type V CRISPR-associated protein Cas4 n=1 Tax=Candidatus Roizmanbacteria bacterium CG_4_9_14_0_2_um_filter_39_13 TaxID=1974839 RepID=A0A2M8F4S3_9BACT|nr:MAG: type V CRISPR-associated protein Cas4 [Candidatus Roizmanbacteria bacterium CG_4_10_14_0_2_um_filter_39_12]PJC34304.1 MAG: type V CRISPR-associated protein Cas4 [Candidatus Roizmanbacteria bacterium CG_4_9_14_0_2_um_filter_39_13]
MDGVIQISKINDFIFCPHSIFLHGVYESFHENLYHEAPQKMGRSAHEKIDTGQYSSAKRYLQGTSVYVSKYNLVGKIDVYDTKEHLLIERKHKLHRLYNGQRYQLYAQYLGLVEAGYTVNKLCIHSLSDNKRYPIDIPGAEELDEFEKVIDAIRSYSVNTTYQTVTKAKCENCIYRQLCHKSLC